MALFKLAIALAAAIALSPASATYADPESAVAPAGTAATRYCMKVEAPTNSRIETIECWTRAEWADQGVDVDKDWAREGVRVLEPAQA